jgi:drug/metabolite transporter (DMT)-like permease
VRTVGLIEVLFAQLISSYVFRHPTTLREKLGVILVLAGVVMLVLTHA